jgi:succinyl-CoA synthetase alpha subunit
LAGLAALAANLARAKGRLSAEEERDIVGHLQEAPAALNAALDHDEQIAAMAHLVVPARDVLYLGRGPDYPMALEGALKLKEISYIHAEGYAAGEMKHGPIALIDDNVPVIVLAPSGPLFDRGVAMIIDAQTKVVVQGITGHQGRAHTRAMLDFGTDIVAGVTPGKGGEVAEGVPVYDTVREAVREHGATASVIFVPAAAAKDSALEALEAGLETVVLITEHVPVHDAMSIVQFARLVGSRVIGPNCPGISVPGRSKLGIMPNQIFLEGSVGVVSRSGTLTYEVVSSLTESGLGQSTCIGIGGDPVVGISFVDALRLFEDDDRTDEVVLIGEIGGSAEEEAAEFIRTQMQKPVVAYIAGRTAPPGKRMGHAGAIVYRGKGTAKSKIDALELAGASVADRPSAIPSLINKCRRL